MRKVHDYVHLGQFHARGAIKTRLLSLARSREHTILNENGLQKTFFSMQASSRRWRFHASETRKRRLEAVALGPIPGDTLRFLARGVCQKHLGAQKPMVFEDFRRGLFKTCCMYQAKSTVWRLGSGRASGRPRSQRSEQKWIMVLVSILTLDWARRFEDHGQEL